MNDTVCVSGGFDPLHSGHLEMFHDAAGWWVADRGSTNGTWLNGARLDGQPAGPLRAGDILDFATVAFSVESATPEGGAELPGLPGDASSPALEELR